jgi:fructokinase
VWQVVSYYLASLCLSIFLVANPEVIVLGGGVLGRTVLYEQVRAWFGKLNNGYVQHSRLEHMQSFIVPPALLNDSALLGASMLD